MRARHGTEVHQNADVDSTTAAAVAVDVVEGGDVKLGVHAKTDTGVATQLGCT